MQSDETGPTKRITSMVGTVVGRLLVTAIGVGLAGFSLWWGIGAVRTYLEPEVPVHVSCVDESLHESCPATWTIDGRLIHGRATDPFGGHSYSRLDRYIDESAVLKLHVSGTKATMSPSRWNIPAALFGVFWGVAIASQANKALSRRLRMGLRAIRAG